MDTLILGMVTIKFLVAFGCGSLLAWVVGNLLVNIILRRWE